MEKALAKAKELASTGSEETTEEAAKEENTNEKAKDEL